MDWCHTMGGTTRARGGPVAERQTFSKQLNVVVSVYANLLCIEWIRAQIYRKY